MLARPEKHQKPAMNRTTLIACSILLLLSFCSEVLATSKYESSSDLSKPRDHEKTLEMYLTPRLGRRKRNLKDDAFKLTEQELAEMWDLFGESPTALITINGNEKFICKTMQVKRDAPEFVPRLGRNLDDFGSEKWLREAVVAEGDERSPPFAPRLGRRLSTYTPRLGRETMKMPGNQSTDNGIYEYEENSYFSEGLDQNGVEEFNTPAENDFSEYLWMEHEEEFDKEVMQRLEEEALMEECMEAFMNDENNSTNSNTQTGNTPCPENVANSKLNPEAAEFVPSSRRAPQEVPATTSS